MCWASRQIKHLSQPARSSLFRGFSFNQSCARVDVRHRRREFDGCLCSESSNHSSDTCLPRSKVLNPVFYYLFIFFCLDKHANPGLIYTCGTFTQTSGVSWGLASGCTTWLIKLCVKKTKNKPNVSSFSFSSGWRSLRRITALCFWNQGTHSRVQISKQHLV